MLQLRLDDYTPLGPQMLLMFLRLLVAQPEAENQQRSERQHGEMLLDRRHGGMWRPSNP